MDKYSINWGNAGLKAESARLRRKAKQSRDRANHLDESYAEASRYVADQYEKLAQMLIDACRLDQS